MTVVDVGAGTGYFLARLSAAVEHAPTPQEFARHYAAFSHWMITQGPRHSGQNRVTA